MANIHVVCFLASYSVAFALELTRLLGRSSISRLVMLFFGTAGFVAHTSYLWFRGRALDLPPLLSSAHDWLLVVAWLAILFYLFLTTIDRDLAVGLFLLPLVLIMIASAYFVSDSTKVGVSAVRGWGMLHAAMLAFGAAGVLAGLVLSLMYLVQHRRLKNKKTLQLGLSLPSLDRLGRWNWWAIVISVPLLTLGLLIGVGLSFALRNTANAMHMTDPVIVGNGLVWLLMVAFFVWLLRTRRPAGKQVAWLTIWSCGFLLATIIILQVLTGGGLESWHG